MEFFEKLKTLSSKVKLLSPSIQTEEATKNAFIMPFINTVLGFDVFDPTEVIPEFVCDIGTKKGEKVDYAILKERKVQILVEAKKIGDPLNINHADQLFRYFHATEARIAILTNGQVYKFYTDLDAPNKMDEKPFLELDLLDIDENAVPELMKMTKASFDVDSIINSAGELRYIREIKKMLGAQLSAPDEDFARFFATRVYDGAVTSKVRDQFVTLTKKASTQFLNNHVNERLKLAMNTDVNPGFSLAIQAEDYATQPPAAEPGDEDEDKVVTTSEETEGYLIVKSIIRSSIDVSRITGRDTQSYFGILIDDNNRKPICRLHFNRSKKYIELFDENKAGTRHAIESLDDIFAHSETLKESAALYV